MPARFGPPNDGAALGDGPRSVTSTKTFAPRLLAWFDDHQRDLPWRGPKVDAWATWVSEIMLQQTRVEAVVAAFQRFIARFPTPAEFAAADDETLLEAWKGLGYYRRARLLRDGARCVVDDHGGRIPSTAAALGTLPGIGVYTRGAIASIAFGEAVPAVDGNVERVFARHQGIADNVKSTKTRRQIEALVIERISKARAGDFNQALMELGATVCKPRNPDCSACPIRSDCEARASGRVDELPVLPPRKKATEVHSRVVVCRDASNGYILGLRNPEGAINQGQLDLPGPGVLVDCADARSLEDSMTSRHGASIVVGPELTRVHHGITHHRITLTAHEGLPGQDAIQTFEAAAPDSPLWTTIARKVLKKIHRERDAS